MERTERPPYAFFTLSPDHWTWMATGASAISVEYSIDADRATLLAATGLPADADDDALTAALEREAAGGAEAWLAERGIRSSQFETWNWSFLGG